MKTNLSIEMTDEQRLLLAQAIDGRKHPLASRKEVVAIVMAYWDGMIASLENSSYTAPAEPVTADLEAALLTRGYEPGSHAAQQFIRGWNRKPSKH